MYISNQIAESGCSAGLGCSQGVGALTMDGTGLFGTGVFGTGVTLTDFSTWGAGEIGAVAAFLFLLYETAGIFANLIGGWLAVRYGIPRMLASGLSAQIAGLLMLSALDPAWSAAASVAWVVIAQGICGVAKDLTKTASKSAIKATSQDGNAQLFRWVAWFTGSKNATKGASSSI